MKKYLKSLALLTCLLNTVHVDGVNWIPPNAGDWNTGANWTGGVPPTNATTAVVNVTGGIAQLTTPPLGQCTTFTIGSLGVGSSVEVNSGADLTASGTSSIANQVNFIGTLDVQGNGSTVSLQTVNLGSNANAIGTLNVSNQASVTTGNIFMGNVLGGQGFINLSNGGNLTSGNIGVGSSGSFITSIVNVTSGATLNTSNVSVPVSSAVINKQGELNISGSTWNNSGSISVGNGGAGGGIGVITVDDGATVITTSIGVGSSGGTGELNVAGAGTTITTVDFFGGQGPGTQSTTNILDGAVVSVTAIIFGPNFANSGGTSVVNISGPGSAFNAVSMALTFGGNATTTATISDGGHANITSNTTIAFDPTSVGVLNLNGTAGSRGLLTTRSIIAGVDGTMNFDGGILQANQTFANFLNVANMNVLAGGAFIDSQNFNIGTTATSGFSGQGQVTKLGSGTFTTNANNTNAGWNVNEGTVIANALLTGPAVVNNNASLIVNGNVSGSTVVNDFGTVVVNGALNGPATVNNSGQLGVEVGGVVTGPATINNNGVAVVNGTVLGLVTTNDSGILYGTGTVGSLINGGIVAPGVADIGTLTVLGNHVNTPTGTHQNELNAAGQTDLLVVGGTSTIQGGTLDLQAAPGAYLAGTSYTLITAAGGLSGQFATVVDNLPINYILKYFSNSLVLQLGDAINFHGLGCNSRRVAEYINTFGTFSDDSLTILEALQSLSFDNLHNALDQLQPASFQALSITSGDAAHAVNDSFMDRLNFLRITRCGQCCDPCDQGGVWISGLANYVSFDRVGCVRGFDATNGGFAIGYDKCFCDNIIAGVGAGYSDNYIKWNRHFGHSDGQNAYLGVYATQFNEDYYADVSLLGFKGTYKSKRHIEFADIDRRAKSKQCNWGINPHFGSGLILDYCGFDVIPFGEIDYYYLSQDKFREHGANSLNLHVKSNDASALRLETGVRFAKAYDCGCGQFLPYASISYVGHRYYGRKFKSSFNDQPENFSVFGVDRCFNQAEFGLGFAYLINDQFAINASYDIDVGSKRQQQEFNFELNYRF